MKKFIFSATCIIVALMSTVNFCRIWEDGNTPLLSLLNLEQLAYGEGGNTGGEGRATASKFGIA